MLDRGLHRSYSRAATAEAEARLHQPYAAEARLDLRDLPTFTIDPDDARDFDDAISARREGDRVRVWVHIADVTAYVRPGGRLEREAFRRGTSVYVPGAVEPMLPEVLSNSACSLRPGEDKFAVTVEMVMSGADVASVAFHRSIVRSDTRLTYGDVDELFAGRARAEEPWGEPLTLAREARRRAARAARFARDRLVRADVRVRLGRSRDRRALRAADGVAPPDRDADDPRERAGGRATSPTGGCPRSTACTSAPTAVGRLPRRAAREPGHPDAAAAEADDPAAGGRRRDRDLAHRRGESKAEARPRRARAARAEAGLLLAAQPGHAGLGSPRYCHFTSPIRRYPDIVVSPGLLQGLGIDEAATPAHELDEAAVLSSANEREAMQVERDADDVCLSFLLERALSEASPEEPPSFEGEVVGLIEKGAFVELRRGAIRGLPAGQANARMVDAERGGDGARRPSRSGRRLRLGDPIAVEVDRVDAPRGRVDLSAYSYAMAKKASAGPRRATSRRTARRASVTTCSRRGRRASR